MFAVMNGFIIALILSSSSSRHQYKNKMDIIMVSLLQHVWLQSALLQSVGALHAAAAD